jgi:hypothetical protein
MCQHVKAGGLELYTNFPSANPSSDARVEIQDRSILLKEVENHNEYFL